MARGLLMASVGVAALFGSSGALAEAQAQPAPAQRSRTTNYDAGFFAQYAPRTALDVVQRIPGFTLDLGANNNGADIRGFAGVAGNVVVNGQRPSTKS